MYTRVTSEFAPFDLALKQEYVYVEQNTGWIDLHRKRGRARNYVLTALRRRS